MEPCRQSRGAAEVITSGEEVFEKWRKTTGLVAGSVVFLIIYFMESPVIGREAYSLFDVIGLVFLSGLPRPSLFSLQNFSVRY